MPLFSKKKPDAGTSVQQPVAESTNTANGSNSGVKGIRIVEVKPRASVAASLEIPNAAGSEVAAAQIPVPPVEFDERVKSFTPFVVQMLKLVVAIGDNVVKAQASDICSTEQIERLQRANTPEDEQIDYSAKCGARLLARRVENPNVVDLMGLCSFGVSYVSGVAIVVSELKKLKAIAEKANHGRADTDAGKVNPSQVADRQSVAQ